MNFPEGLKDKTLDTYAPQSPHQAAALRIAKGIIEGSEEVNAVRGLFFHGPVGTGKTHLQAGIYNGLDIDEDRKLWIPSLNSGDRHQLLEAFLYNKTDQRNLIENADAIFLDEFTIANLTSGQVKAIIDFIGLAYERQKRLFFSSNHPLSEVANRMEKEGKVIEKDQNGGVTEVREISNLVSGRIHSRLIELLTPVEVLGVDYRDVLAKRAQDQVTTILEEEMKKAQPRP